MTNSIPFHRIFWRKFRLGVISVFWAVMVYASIGDAYADNSSHAHTSARVFEINFLKQMMDHHLLAVYMAALCQQRAMHADLIAMCVRMEASQRDEITTMKEWLHSWYGIEHTPALNQMDVMKLQAMRSISGEKFEIKFMTEMIPHHATAINSSLRCLVRGAQVNLLQLCESIITTQASEILQLRQWLCDWYQRCVLYAEAPVSSRPMPVKLHALGI